MKAFLRGATALSFVLVCSVFAVACGDDSSGDGDDDGDGNSSSSSETFTCCVNCAFFDCSSQDALDQCFDTGGDSCTRDSGRDDECTGC